MKFKKKERRELSLPTAESEPLTALEDFAFWIYGPPGIGKTTLGQQFKTGDKPPLHILFEDGAKALRLHAIHIREWGDVPKYQRLVERSRDFGAVIVDTAEAAYDCCWRFMQERDGWEHPNEVEYGKAWDSISRPTVKFIKAMLSQPDKGGMVISHAKTGTRKTRDGDEFEDIHPNLGGKMLEEIAGLVDVVGYYYYSKGQNWLRIRQTEDIYAKCRLEENFLHTDGSPVRVIPMGTNKAEAWERLNQAFNNELDPEETKKKKLKMKRR